MKEKTNQKGFIQIPILIAIIGGILVLGGGGYFGVKQYQNYQIRKIEKVADDQFSEIEKLKKEVVELKNKNNSIATEPKEIIPIVEVSNSQLVNSTPLPIETWDQLENKYFASANQKGWISQTIINALGEERYYRKEGDLWVRKNSKTESQQTYVLPPTQEQLATLRYVCLMVSGAQVICDDPSFMPGYYSNLVFRAEIDKLNARFITMLSDQQRQKIATEKQMFNCLADWSPEEQRGLTADAKIYFLQVKCGTVTVEDKINYELSRLKSSADELQYRLDSKIAFPSLYLDAIKVPTFNIPQWQIRWEGSGGTVSDSSGNFYQFRCEDNFCRSY